MHPTRIDLPADLRAKAAALCNQRLADLLDLHSQIKQAHWNVRGPSFAALHELFDTVAEQVEEHADEVAERAVALGHSAHGTVRVAAAKSTLHEYPLDLIDQRRHLETVADRIAAVGKSVRAAIDLAADMGEADLADLFTGVSRDLDKSLWMVEAHLHGA